MCQSYPNPQKDSPTDPSNYRPSSFLPTYSTISEKLMHKKLYEFLNKMDAFYSLQFCFRDKHSTNHALITLYNVCSVHRGCSLHWGVFSTMGDTMSTLRDIMSTLGCSVHQGDIMSTLGDTMSALGMFCT